MVSEHIRYLGTLGLLSECSVHVPEELRESIAQAMLDAVAANTNLEFRRVLNRLEVEVRVEKPTPPPKRCGPGAGTSRAGVLRKKRA